MNMRSVIYVVLVILPLILPANVSAVEFAYLPPKQDVQSCALLGDHDPDKLILVFVPRGTNIRSGASTNFSVVDSGPQYFIAIPVNDSPNWYELLAQSDANGSYTGLLPRTMYAASFGGVIITDLPTNFCISEE